MIICLGTTPALQKTLTFERVTIDQVNRAREVVHSPAGKSVNVAKITRTLGREALAITLLGGQTGAFIQDELRRAGVQGEFVEVPAPTRTCTTVIDRAAGTVTELVEESAAVQSEAAEQLLAKLEAHLAAARGLVLSGSLAPGVPSDFYVRCIGAAAKYGMPVILDAQGEPLRVALESRPMLIKPNRTELAATLGMAMDSDEALKQGMRRMVQKGPQWIAVTMGREGAVISDGQRFWRVHSPAVKAVNPIGSGDAFSAGLMAGILNGQSVPEACKLAAACGAANALTPVSGCVYMDDVDRLLSLVRVEPM
jgi:tagatose 6-phosphate kinase